MPVPRPRVDFTFTTGLDQFIDERQTVKLQTATNVQWTAARQLRCRPGYKTITAANSAASTWKTIAGVSGASPYQELLGFDGLNAWEYIGKTGTWKSGDKALSAKVTKANTNITKNVSGSTFACTDPDIAYGNGYFVYVYQSGTTLYHYAEDATTGAIVLAEGTTNLAEGVARPKVIYATTANKFYVFYYNTGADSLKYYTIDGTTLAVSGLSTITLFSAPLAASQIYDVAYNNTLQQFVLCWMHDGATYCFETFNTSLTGINSHSVPITAFTDTNFVMSIAYSADGNTIYGALGVSRAGATKLLGYAAQNTAALPFRFSAMSEPGTVLQSSWPYGVGFFKQLGVVESNAGTFEFTIVGTLEDVITDGSVSQTVDSTYSWRVVNSASTAIVQDGTATRALTLMTRPWLASGRVYAHCISLASATAYALDFTSSSNNGAPTSTGSGFARPVAIWNGRTAGRPLPKTWAEALRSASTVASVVFPTASTPTSLTEQIQLQTPDLDSLVQRVTLDFTWGMNPPVRAVNNWFLPNGLPMRVSRFRVLESCPLGAPNISVTNGAAGGSLSTGSYVYQACYAVVTDDGEIVRGPFSNAVTYSATAGTKASVGIIGPPPTLSQFGFGAFSFAPIIEIYRTQVNQSVLYQLVSSQTAALATGMAFYADGAADAGLNTILPAYWNGGGFANVEPNGCQFAARIKDRVWAGPGDDGLTIYYSDSLTENAAAIWHDENNIFIDHGGPFTGIAGLDGKTILFKQRHIFWMAGEPGNSAGNGSTLGTPQELPSAGVGCINARSIVVTNDGVMFQSARGIELLDRSMNLQWIGAAVTLTLAGGTITGSILIPEEHQVRFFLSSGAALVYDTVVKEWSVFVYAGSITGATLWQSAPIWSGSTGAIFQERASNDAARFSDDSAFIAMSVTTDWKKLTGLAGFYRLLKLQFLTEAHGSAGISFAYAVDYDNTTLQTTAWTAAEVAALPDYSVGRAQFEINPARQKIESFQLAITTTAPSVVDGTEGLWLNGFTLEYQPAETLYRLGALNRK